MQYRICALALFTSLAAATLIGCSGKASGYPEVNAQSSALTGAQPCHQCGKKIEAVGDEHRLQVGAASYVVCSEACRNKQRAWHESQFGK